VTGGNQVVSFLRTFFKSAPKGGGSFETLGKPQRKERGEK